MCDMASLDSDYGISVRSVAKKRFTPLIIYIRGCIFYGVQPIVVSVLSDGVSDCCATSVCAGALYAPMWR